MWRRGRADGLDVIAIGGSDYTDCAAHAWPDLVRVLDGAKGIGEQMRRLAQIYKTDPVEDIAAAQKEIDLTEYDQEHVNGKSLTRGVANGPA